jgi:cell wall-associated NlpC family hydrolase
LNAASSLSAAVSRAAKPASKASAVLAVSGGMVASFALPATAATVSTDVKTQALPTSTASLAPSAAPAPLALRTFGEINFKGVVKARPVVITAPVATPVAQQRTVNRVSRSVTRTSFSPASTQTHQPAVPALAPRASGVSGVLGIAASLAGIPYRFGGTTRAGFDCSGFSQYVFAKVGISLPRVAEAQRQATTRVSRVNARPGDLVFFGAPASHMGIYAGNGMMWDSPRTGKAISKRAVYSASATFGRV